MGKRIFLAIMLSLSYAAAAFGANLREKVYISTDKGVYVAGDRIWYSAYCMDVNTGKLSDFSKIAYIELHDAYGTVQTGKVALAGGRGAGMLELQNTLPTGNYKLLAYTAQCCNEEGFDFAENAVTISVFNTFSTERVKDGVELVGDEEYAAAQNGFSPAQSRLQAASGNLSISAPAQTEAGGMATLRVTNNGSTPVSFNLSVYLDDGIAAPESRDIRDFAGSVRNAPAAAGFGSGRIAEYEGEVITARVTGLPADSMGAVVGKSAFLSAPGSAGNMYTNTVGSDGKVRFFTSNIYGDKDMFLEIEGLDSTQVCHLEVESPFVRADAGPVGKLRVSKSMAAKLEARSMAMQLEKVFGSDTLYEYLPENRHEVFEEGNVRYVLDDYTRFPVMEEVVVEFVTELRARNLDGRRDLRVQTRDSYDGYEFAQGSSLVLLDGIPVLDHEKLLKYDPLLVKSIEIYPHTYNLGSRMFAGVADFVTYKGSLPGFSFADNVRIVNYQGASVPMACTLDGENTDFPDFRQTAYWHPLLEVGAGETLELKVKLPGYEGKFAVKAEGLVAGSEPVVAHTEFSAR